MSSRDAVHQAIDAVWRIESAKLIAHVARVHGGRARIESAPGEGTRLEVRLPSWTPRAEPSPET